MLLSFLVLYIGVKRCRGQKAPNYDARKGEGICLLFPNAFSQDSIHDPQLCQI